MKNNTQVPSVIPFAQNVVAFPARSSPRSPSLIVRGAKVYRLSDAQAAREQLFDDLYNSMMVLHTVFREPSLMVEVGIEEGIRCPIEIVQHFLSGKYREAFEVAIRDWRWVEDIGDGRDGVVRRSAGEVMEGSV